MQERIDPGNAQRAGLMSSRRLCFLVLAVLLVTPWVRGHHRWIPRSSSMSFRRVGGIDPNLPVLSSRTRPSSISTLALAAYRLKSEREETGEQNLRHSAPRRLSLPGRVRAAIAETCRSHPIPSVAPLRC